MAFQLGALNTPRTELVKQDPYKSGNYSNLFSQMNRNQEALGQREDRATLNALGSAKAEAIMDGQAGSAKLQGIRKAQTKALDTQNIPLYDKLTGELKAQMQIESAEAKADPLGKTQLGRDKLALSEKDKSLLSDPRVIQLREVQDSTKLEAQKILSQAIATTDKNVRNTLNTEYDALLDKNWEADRQLTAFGLAKHHKNPMVPWVKALGGMAKQSGEENIANARVKKIMAELKVSETQAREIDAKIEREKQAHKQATTLRGESIKQAKEKTKSVTEGSAKEKEFAQFAKELIRLDKIISNASSADLWKKAVSFGTMPTVMSTALDNYTEAILREKSGAAIGIQEEASDKTRYTPSIIDSPEVVAEKARIRAGHINKIIANAGNAYKDGGYSSSFKSGGEAPTTRNKVYNPSTDTFE